MSPALALMPAIAPEPPRSPEQLVFGAAAFVELLFAAPARARAACRRTRHVPRATPARQGTAAAALLAWRPPSRSPRPARGQPASIRPAPAAVPLRASRPAPRARVVAARPLSKQERGHLARGASLSLPVLPATRAGCATVPRPCRFVSCSQNLYLDVTTSGAIKLNYPHLEPHEMRPNLSCVLDVADQKGVSLEVVGAALNVSMERARQLVDAALAKGKAALRAEDVDIETDEDA